MVKHRVQPLRFPSLKVALAAEANVVAKAVDSYRAKRARLQEATKKHADAPAEIDTIQASIPEARPAKPDGRSWV